MFCFATFLTATIISDFNIVHGQQNYRVPINSTFLTFFRNCTKNVVVETIIAPETAYLHLHLLGQHTQRPITAAVIAPVAVIKAAMMGIPVFTNVLCPPAPVGSLAVAVHVGRTQTVITLTCDDYYAHFKITDSRMMQCKLMKRCYYWLCIVPLTGHCHF